MCNIHLSQNLPEESCQSQEGVMSYEANEAYDAERDIDVNERSTGNARSLAVPVVAAAAVQKRALYCIPTIAHCAIMHTAQHRQN